MKAKTRSDTGLPTVIGIDIGKEVFHLVGLGADGRIALRRKIKRKRLGLKDAFERLPPCIVGMEACLSAHFVSRTLRALGHEPRIIPAIYLKPFVKGQKNDYNDAEAIAEAALRANLRFVQEKSQDQLDLQACHRVRSRLVSRRTATINQIRAFLIEQGIAANEDIARTAVAVLMAPERHDGKTYRPTGPQLLSGREMAHIVATVVGHPVRPVHVPFWLFNKTARWRQGVEPFLISARQRGLAFRELSMLVGAIVIARASDPKTARDVLAACKAPA
jgi:hypothetical protein